MHRTISSCRSCRSWQPAVGSFYTSVVFPLFPSEGYALTMSFAKTLWGGEALAIGDCFGHLTLAKTNPHDEIKVLTRRMPFSTASDNPQLSRPVHAGTITCLKWHSDCPSAESCENRVISGSTEGYLAMTDIESEHVQWKIYAHVGWVNALTSCPQQPAVLLTAGADGYVKVWDERKVSSAATASFSPLRRPRHGESATAGSDAHPVVCRVQPTQEVNTRIFGFRETPARSTVKRLSSNPRMSTRHHSATSHTNFSRKKPLIPQKSCAVSTLAFVDGDSTFAVGGLSGSVVQMYDMRMLRLPCGAFAASYWKGAVSGLVCESGVSWMDSDEHFSTLLVSKTDGSVLGYSCSSLRLGREWQEASAFVVKGIPPGSFRAGITAVQPSLSGDGRWFGLPCGRGFSVFDLASDVPSNAPCAEFSWYSPADYSHSQRDQGGHVGGGGIPGGWPRELGPAEMMTDVPDSSVLCSAWNRNMHADVAAFASVDGRICIIRGGEGPTRLSLSAASVITNYTNFTTHFGSERSSTEGEWLNGDEDTAEKLVEETTPDREDGNRTQSSGREEREGNSARGSKGGKETCRASLRLTVDPKRRRTEGKVSLGGMSKGMLAGPSDRSGASSSRGPSSALRPSSSHESSACCSTPRPVMKEVSTDESSSNATNVAPNTETTAAEEEAGSIHCHQKQHANLHIIRGAPAHLLQLSRASAPDHKDNNLRRSSAAAATQRKRRCGASSPRPAGRRSARSIRDNDDKSSQPKSSNSRQDYRAFPKRRQLQTPGQHMATSVNTPQLIVSAPSSSGMKIPTGCSTGPNLSIGRCHVLPPSDFGSFTPSAAPPRRDSRSSSGGKSCTLSVLAAGFHCNAPLRGRYSTLTPSLGGGSSSAISSASIIRRRSVQNLSGDSHHEPKADDSEPLREVGRTASDNTPSVVEPHNKDPVSHGCGTLESSEDSSVLGAGGHADAAAPSRPQRRLTLFDFGFTSHR